MDERTERIIQVAMELAEEDGYDAVRLRDLAARADVALGTVYRRFSSKEDILAAALDLQVTRFHEAVHSSPIDGPSPHARLSRFFQLATEALAMRPKLAGAMFRTVASGVPELAERVLRYNDMMVEILVVVMRGEVRDAPPTDNERLAADLCKDLWFATMVGWTGGLHEASEVAPTMDRYLEVLFRAMEV